MYPHRIRLRGPWECEPLARADGGAVPPRLRMTMPCRWRDGGLADFAGRVRFVRRFGLPRQIDEHERLWLSFGGLTGTADVLLNGALLGQISGGSEFEVTARLRDRNELIVEMDGGPDGGLWGETALIIRATAYLTDLQPLPDGGVAGKVIGTALRPLDLYLLHEGKTVRHMMATPTAEGATFALHPEEKTQEPAPEVRVDLIDGGVIWDSQVVN